MQKKIILSIIILIFSTFCVFADEISNKNILLKKGTNELLTIGNRYKDNNEFKKALEVYSIITDREDKLTDDNEIRDCCNAYIKTAQIYLSTYFDYSKANDNILAAERLQDKANKSYTFVYSAISAFYHTFAVTSHDTILMQKALHYSKKAFDIALEEDNRHNLNTFIANMIIMSGNIHDMSILDKAWRFYKDDKSYEYNFNNLYYNYYKSFFINNFANSVSKAKKMLKLSSDSMDIKRMLISYTSIINALEQQGNFREVLRYITKEEHLARQLNMRDDLLELIKSKELIYRKLGDLTTADSLANYYNSKKDSLISPAQSNNIYRTLFDCENLRMENEIIKINKQKQSYNNLLIIVIACVVLLIIMFIMLYVKHKRLKKEQLKIYEDFGKTLTKKEQELKKLKQELRRFEETVIVQSADEVSLEEKYKKNFLSDVEKKKLLDRILTVMDDVDEICSETFSGTRLAELTGYKYNYVSLVINENFGCNFNSLLNDYRVKEACKRLADDDNYGNYTIDSISQGLGFKSKTTLNNAFKKIVGITPSQYRKIAKDKNIE